MLCISMASFSAPLTFCIEVSVHSSYPSPSPACVTEPRRGTLLGTNFFPNLRESLSTFFFLKGGPAREGHPPWIIPRVTAETELD